MLRTLSTLIVVIPDLIRYPDFTFRGVKLDAGSSPTTVRNNIWDVREMLMVLELHDDVV